VYYFGESPIFAHTLNSQTICAELIKKPFFFQQKGNNDDEGFASSVCWLFWERSCNSSGCANNV
jgi:hypothetical protein